MKSHIELTVRFIFMEKYKSKTNETKTIHIRNQITSRKNNKTVVTALQIT